MAAAVAKKGMAVLFARKSIYIQLNRKNTNQPPGRNGPMRAPNHSQRPSASLCTPTYPRPCVCVLPGIIIVSISLPYNLIRYGVIPFITPPGLVPLVYMCVCSSMLFFSLYLSRRHCTKEVQVVACTVVGWVEVPGSDDDRCTGKRTRE